VYVRACNVTCSHWSARLQIAGGRFVAAVAAAAPPDDVAPPPLPGALLSAAPAPDVGIAPRF